MGASGGLAESAPDGEQAPPAGWDAEAQPGGGGSASGSLEPAKSLAASVKTDYEEDDAELHRHGQGRRVG